MIRGLTAVGFVGKIVSSSENLNLWPPPPKLYSHGATGVAVPARCLAALSSQILIQFDINAIFSLSMHCVSHLSYTQRRAYT